MKQESPVLGLCGASKFGAHFICPLRFADMITARVKLLLMVGAALLGQGCSPSPARKAHHFDAQRDTWIIELPNTATAQEVISNYFQVLEFSAGVPVASGTVEFANGAGKVLSRANLPVQKIKEYRIIEQSEAYCGGGIFQDFDIDTDLGRKRVLIELARNHSSDPNTTGWACNIYDFPTNILSSEATQVQP